MPILSSVSAEDLGPTFPTDGLSTTAAFTVLSADSLSTHHHQPSTGVAEKPNAIVRPVRRRDPRDYSELFDNAGTATMAMGKHLPNDHHDDGGAVVQQRQHFGLGNFTKELDMKLRRLQGGAKKSSSKNVRTTD